jgi:hypothetical protein
VLAVDLYGHFASVGIHFGINSCRRLFLAGKSISTYGNHLSLYQEKGSVMAKSQSQQKGDALSNNADDSAQQAKQIGKWAAPAVGVLAAAAICPPAVMALGLLYGLTKLGSSGGGGGQARIAPDGQPTFVGCAHCGSPVSAGHPICARCGRRWIGR